MVFHAAFLQLLSCFPLLISLAHAGAYPPDSVDKLASASMSKLQDYIKKNGAKNNCTLENAVKRLEW
jgi:tyrosinase